MDWCLTLNRWCKHCLFFMTWSTTLSLRHVALGGGGAGGGLPPPHKHTLFPAANSFLTCNLLDKIFLFFGWFAPTPPPPPLSKTLLQYCTCLWLCMMWSFQLHIFLAHLSQRLGWAFSFSEWYFFCRYKL